jgi:hypothetical protein
MNQPQLRRPPTVRETVARWEHRTASRIGFRDPGRPPFDRRLFLKQFWEDHPGDPRATELADVFERAVKEARGNVTRFRQKLERELSLIL